MEMIFELTREGIDNREGREVAKLEITVVQVAPHVAWVSIVRRRGRWAYRMGVAGCSLRAR